MGGQSSANRKNSAAAVCCWGQKGKASQVTDASDLSEEDYSYAKQTTKIMENPETILQNGLELVTIAVEEDKNHNYEEALRCYVQGVMYFLHIANYNTESQQAKDRITRKCAEYILRIKKIKDFRNRILGVGLIDNLETLSDSNVLNMVTEIICMCGDYMELKFPESVN